MILAVAAVTYVSCMRGFSPAGNSPRLRPHVEDEQLQDAPIISIDAMAEKKWPRILRVKSAVQEPSGVLISVADTGKGIDPKIIDRIFNPLFTTKSNGMGMGLAICRSIIEGHGGRLWASAGAEGVSVFQFVLPANIAR